MAALTSVWVAGALLGWGSPRHAVWVSDTTMPILAVLAATLLLRAARRRQRGARRSYVLLGLACLMWALGEGIWGWYELVLGVEVPYPSVADVAYLGATPLAAAGLLSLPRGLRQRSQWARAALDAWLVAGSLLALSWLLLLKDLLQEQAGGSGPLVVSLAYPVSDVLLATVALLVMRRASGTQRRTTLILAAAMLSMAVADSAYTWLALVGGYHSGSLTDTGWILGYLLLALAGWQDDPGGIHPDADRSAGRVGALLPYLAVGLAAGAGVLHVGRGGGLERGDQLLLGSLVLALLLRQALTVLDNVALAAVLELRERHFSSLVHGAKDVIILCGKDLRATYVSPSCLDVLGLDPEAVRGSALWELVHPDDLVTVRDALTAVLDGSSSGGAAMLRCRVASHDGWIDTESTVGDLRSDASVAGIVITTRDVTERTQLENQLRRLAREDPLTGLANRTVLRERLEHALSLRSALASPMGLLLVDLDGFKSVNDTAGHHAGDTLLIDVAARLVASVRQGDTVARLGGDEFALLLEDRGEGDLTQAGLAVANRVLAALERPLVVAGRELWVGASLGLVVARPDSTAESLMSEADVALYASKHAGRGRVTVFDEDLQAQVVRRNELTVDLRTALRDNAFELAYQPVVDLCSGDVVGVEALARWDHAVWGYVPPSEFIPLAESSGLIGELGAWALSGVLRQAEQWQASGRPLDVAVNVSARQLGPEFVALVAQALAGSSLPPRSLTLEITESVLVDDEVTVASLQGLRALGVRLAIDDFGTGWSSLGYLRKLPVDLLKLDRSFVADLGTPEADALCRTVVALALELGLDVVAEGVETVAQRELLQAMGCGYAQGWLFGRAVPASRLAAESARLKAVGSLPSPRRTTSVPLCETSVSES